VGERGEESGELDADENREADDGVPDALANGELDAASLRPAPRTPVDEKNVDELVADLLCMTAPPPPPPPPPPREWVAP